MSKSGNMLPKIKNGLSTILIRNPDTNLLRKTIKDLLDRTLTIKKTCS